MTESLGQSQSRDTDLLLFDSCVCLELFLVLIFLFLALLKERKTLIFSEVLWPFNACFSEMELTVVFPLQFGLGSFSGSNYFSQLL